LRNHLHDLVIEDISQCIQIRSKLNFITFVTFLSSVELKNVKEVCINEFSINAMQ